MIKSIELAQKYGKCDSETLEKAVIAALSLTPYIRYRGEDRFGEKNFFEVIGQLRPFLYKLNELRAFDVQRVMMDSFKIYRMRYVSAIHPCASMVFSDQNLVLNTLQAVIGCSWRYEWDPLVSALHSDFTRTLKVLFVSTGE